MTDQSKSADTPIGRNEAKGWLHNPELPIDMSPVFHWPPRPLAALQWLGRSWLRLSSILIIFALALLGTFL